LTEKLDNLSRDVLSLLEKHEPDRLRHHEICDSLWSSYPYNYKDKKVFGVAVTQKLNLLKAKGLILHEDIWYGTVNSKPIEKKPSSEKPSKLGFLSNLLEKRAEHKRERKRESLILRCQVDVQKELSMLDMDDPTYETTKWNLIKEYANRYGLDTSEIAAGLGGL